MIRILIVEDHPVVRRGYVAFISREPNLHICGEAASGQEALAKVPECRPDAVVLDISLAGGMDGVDLLRELKRLYPKLPVLVVSASEEMVYGEMVIKSGAWGYVMKGDVNAFMAAVRALAQEAARHIQQRGEQQHDPEVTA